jgi:Zn-dependent protease
MLLSLLRGGFNPLEMIIQLFVLAFVVFCTMPVHEFAHAFVATKLGDKTPKFAGRLTLNPMAHISPLGALMILVCGFGYAKPVSVNARNFKNPKAGMALTALAGPVSNLLMAFVFIFISKLVVVLASNSVIDLKILSAVYTFLYLAARINVNLAVFNLLPIPPLDGSRIFQIFVPNKYYYKMLEYERYIVIVVFVLLYMDILTIPINLLLELFMNLFNFIINLPLREKRSNLFSLF